MFCDMVLIFYTQAGFVGMEWIMNSYHYKAVTSFFMLLTFIITNSVYRFSSGNTEKFSAGV